MSTNPVAICFENTLVATPPRVNKIFSNPPKLSATVSIPLTIDDIASIADLNISSSSKESHKSSISALSCLDLYSIESTLIAFCSNVEPSAFWEVFTASVYIDQFSNKAIKRDACLWPASAVATPTLDSLFRFSHIPPTWSITSPMSLRAPVSSNTDTPIWFNAFSTLPVVQPSSSSPPACSSDILANIVLKVVPIVSGASLVTVVTVANIPFNWSISTPTTFAIEATLDIPTANSSKSEPVAAPTAANLSVTSRALLASIT